jgi:hypothetical protein
LVDDDRAYSTYSLEGEMRNKVWGFVVFAVAYELEPENIEAQVQGFLADHPELSLEREGVAVGTIPGSTPYAAVYVTVNERVFYKINVYADDPEVRGLDAARNCSPTCASSRLPGP